MTRRMLTCQTTFEDSRPLHRVLPVLNEFRKTNSFSDVEIELSNGERHTGHRVILAARIPALKDELLRHCSKRVIMWTYPGMLPTAALAIIDYAYTGKLEIAMDTVEGILCLANDLMLGTVSKWCEEFLYSILNLDHIHFVWDLARMGNLSSLIRDCIRKMQETFQDFICRDSFAKLSLDALIQVVQSESLNVQTEDQVVLAISQWTGSLKHTDGTERLPDLLHEVRWNAVSNEAWQRIAGDENVIKLFPHFSDYMKACKAGCGKANDPLIPCPFNRKARCYNKNITLLVGLDNHQNQPEYTFALHDVSKPRESKIICKMPGRKYASAVAFRDKVVIIGGYKPRASNTVMIFDLPTRRSKPAAPMKFSRTECSAVRCGDFIIVFGGKDHYWNHHASCELFRPLKNEWKQLPSSQTARRGAAMVSLEDGRVLLLGGDTGDTILTLVECATLPTDDWRANTAGTYNPFWRRLTPMHEARMAASACVLNGRIFVAGGVSRHNEILQSVEYFVPPKDEKAIGFWTVVQWMNQKRDTFTLLALENRLYAFGY
uniref:BTB domain-containing protein n=1 Tax=Schistocephalus solidus TaxID=70667 RepID=A0A0X3P856_SCHSO